MAVAIALVVVIVELVAVAAAVVAVAIVVVLYVSHGREYVSHGTSTEQRMCFSILNLFDFSLNRYLIRS